MISCLHDRFLDGPLLPTPHLYFLYLAIPILGGLGALWLVLVVGIMGAGLSWHGSRRE